jgi:hypothetical protein
LKLSLSYNNQIHITSHHYSNVVAARSIDAASEATRRATSTVSIQTTLDSSDAATAQGDTPRLSLAASRAERENGRVGVIIANDVDRHLDVDVDAESPGDVSHLF